MNTPHTYQQEELDKPVTLGVLLEYTDEFLIPKMAEIMDEKLNESDRKIDKRFGEIDKRFGELEYNLKSYIDDKLADYT